MALNLMNFGSSPASSERIGGRTLGNSSGGFDAFFDTRNKALAKQGFSYAGGNTPFYSGVDSAAGVGGYIKQRNATGRDEYGGIAGGNAIGPYRQGDYMFSPTGDGRYYAVNTKDASFGTGKTKADIYDEAGKYLGSDFYNTEKSAMGKMWDAAIPLAASAFIGGGIAGGMGMGPFAGSGGVVPPNPFVGGAGAGVAAGGGGGLQSILGGLGLGGGGGAGGLGALLKGGSSLASVIGALSGGGGGQGGNGLLELLAGGLDASRQGQASDRMQQFINSNMQKVENLYKPGSPEYNALWEQMSRQDAAAGRNSQYGPRSVDLAAKIAEIKANNIARMTGQLAPSMSGALNQNAGKYSGLAAGLGSLFGGGGVQNISSLLNSFSGSGSFGGFEGNNPLPMWDATSNDEIWEGINGGDFLDWYE
jgi:hypothetical protein